MTHTTWRWAIVGFTAVVVGAVTFAVVRRPSRQASRLGVRGLKRQRALLDPWWATVEPFVRWFGVRVSGLLEDKTRERLDRELTYAGDFLGLTVDEYLALVVGGAMIGAAVGGTLVVARDLPTVAIAALAAVGAFVPHASVDSEKVRRFRELRRGLPYAIDLMSLGMSAGLDFPGAVHQVVSKGKANTAVRDELGYMLQQFHLGRTRTQALRELALRAPVDSVREFVQALVQAEERGTAVARVLEIQASTSRVKRTHEAEAAAADMKAKLVMPVMMFSAVAMMLVLVPTGMALTRVLGSLR